MAYRFEKRFNSFKKSLESLKAARERDWTDDEESMQVITGEYVSLFEKLVDKINAICEK